MFLKPQRKTEISTFFRIFPGPDPRPGPGGAENFRVKWAKVCQNGSKIEKNRSHRVGDEIPHILIVTSTFFTFGDFRSNFRFLLSLFGPAPLYRPYRPEPVKWPKVGQNGSKIEKKSCHGIPDEIPHILMVCSIFFVFGDFRPNLRFFF